MKLFRPEELEQLVCGRRELDFSALQGAAKYDNGFGPDTPARPLPVGRCAENACAHRCVGRQKGRCVSVRDTCVAWSRSTGLT